MDEVERARAELARLESIERSLLYQMLAVRRAVVAQRIQIEELVKKRNLAIHRLPVELLVRIFGFAMVRENEEPDQFALICERRRSLAGVSRLWRDVILHTPNLWSDIGLTSLQGQTPLVMQLRRSQGVLLDVTITDEAEEELDIERSLNGLLPTANRWRSLYIYCCFDRSGLRATIRKLSKFEFPSLVEISITMNPNFEYADPQILLPRAPTLKHLRLENFIASDDFSTGSPLKTLELIFEDSINIPRSFLSQISTASLIRLTLIGDVNDWVLEPNNIHFPLLEELMVDMPYSGQFLEAIVAPNLQHFHYMDNNSVGNGFGMYGPKFSNVYHLTFDAALFSASCLNGIALCQGFPNTRHAALRSSSLRFFFTPIPMPGNFVGSQISLINLH